MSGAVDDVGVVERAERLERANDALHHVVDRLQRREAPLVLVLEPADVLPIERRHAADEVGLVADVRLVEGRRARQRGMREHVHVRRGHRRAVRRVRQHVDEERQPGGTRLADHLDRLVGQHVVQVVPGSLPCATARPFSLSV